MPRSAVRDTLLGMSLNEDRLWIIYLPDGETLAITEYNDEITGYSPELAALDPKTFYYGGNAYFVLNNYARARGWRVSHHEDRQKSRARESPAK